MNIDVYFVNAKSLISKAGKSFYLATFVFNGEPFKLIVDEKYYNYLLSCDSMSKVSLTLDVKVYNDKLNLYLNDLN